MRQILVIGSSNTDMVIKTGAFPQPGETLLGGTFFMFPGGKGANQAVAAARLGGHVTLITKVGNDIFGQKALAQFREEGINTALVVTDPKNPSGVALITVNDKGENTIVVAPGSNGALSPDDIKVTNPELYNFILLQLEIPIETVVYCAKLFSEKKQKVILNPAPAAQLPLQLYPLLYLITPNQTEAETLTGISTKHPDDLRKAAAEIHHRGTKHVAITLGEQGVFLFDGKESLLVPAPKVNAVDTTAAGDVFNGALTVALSEGAPLHEAAKFANAAAAVSVTKMGAQSSAPARHEINN